MRCLDSTLERANSVYLPPPVLDLYDSATFNTQTIEKMARRHAKNTWSDVFDNQHPPQRRAPVLALLLPPVDKQGRRASRGRPMMPPAACERLRVFL
jgi:hypothetical protein